MISRYKYLLLVIPSLILPIISIHAASSTSSRQYQVQTLTLLHENEKQLTLLSSRVKYLMVNHASLTQDLKKQKQILISEQQNNRQLKREISLLKQQLLDDRKQVQKSLNNMVDRIADETTKTINTALKSSKKTNYSSSSRKGPVGSGEFVEYKVQAGATLSAIAKAYNVSISSIRKANKLNNDIIRIGQIIYIPQ